MKSSIKNKILVFGMITALIACYVVIVTMKEPANNKNEQLKQTFTSVKSYQGRDVKEIKAHFKQFPDSYDKIIKYKVPVITTSMMTNKKMVKDFCQKFQEEKSCSLDMITFGAEGGMTYHYIHYNGKDMYYYCFGNEINDIEETFQYLYLFDIPDRYFNDFDASQLPEPFQELVLSTDEISDYAEYEKLSSELLSSELDHADATERKNSKLRIEGFKISPFRTKKEAKDFLNIHQKK